MRGQKGCQVAERTRCPRCEQLDHKTSDCPDCNAAKLESGGGIIGVPHENEAGSDGRGKWCSLGKNKTPDDSEYIEQRKNTSVSMANVVLADIADADATIGGVHCMDHENQELELTTLRRGSCTPWGRTSPPRNPQTNVEWR